MTLGPEIAFVLMMTITTASPPLHKGDAPVLRTETTMGENFETAEKCEKSASILRARLNTAVGDQKIKDFTLTCVDKRGEKGVSTIPEKHRAKIEAEIREMKGIK